MQQVRVYVVVLFQMLLVCSLAIRVIYHLRVLPAGKVVLHRVDERRMETAGRVARYQAKYG